MTNFGMGSFYFLFGKSNSSNPTKPRGSAIIAVSTQPPKRDPSLMEAELFPFKKGPIAGAEIKIVKETIIKIIPKDFLLILFTNRIN